MNANKRESIPLPANHAEAQRTPEELSASYYTIQKIFGRLFIFFGEKEG